MSKSSPAVKSFQIPKQLVWEAYKRVEANKGAAGVDGQSVEDFEADLKNNLYRIWNRMSSGTYFPSPVRAVEIPKPHGGGTRMLGVPTVADRIAQTVVAMQLEARTESIFHEDSYGYRPGRSPQMAVAKCRERCWRRDWVLDLDIQKFFDSVDHDLMVKAVEVNTDQKWVVLYVRRWLKAPTQMPDGRVVGRDRGTSQGSAVSPVLANLFMHYAFDTWAGSDGRSDAPIGLIMSVASRDWIVDEPARAVDLRGAGDHLAGGEPESLGAVYREAPQPAPLDSLAGDLPE